MKRLLLFVLAATMMVFLSQCSKEGPQGPAGAQGTAGPKGDKGDKGDVGAANVMSKTFQAADISWSSTTIFGTNYKVATLNIPQLTSSIVDNGIVMVYGAFLFGEPWTALPVSIFESGVTRYFFFSVKTGSVVLRYSQSNNVSPGSPSVAFKVVIVPGNNIARLASPSMDYSDYKAVCEYYGIGE